ncbi:MAG: Uma2 family endonuclease, partial [Terriglobales bacterium]
SQLETARCFRPDLIPLYHSSPGERKAVHEALTNIRGAPDLVVEVLSLSNTAAEMLDKEQICLANSAREFWVVHPNRRRVKVTNSQGGTKFYYHGGEEIPLPLFRNASLAVDSILV